MVRHSGRRLYRLVNLQFLPWRLRLACFVVLGMALGLGLALAKVSRATSYLSDEPEACVNCHIMRPQYSTWQHSSHFRVATCNDCHVPHTSLAAAYGWKARDGLYHSAIFTLRMEPQVIHMSRAAVSVVENNCRRCHERVIEQVSIHPFRPDGMRCWDCHREVPHGRSRSLSVTPRVMVPELPGVLRRQVPTIGGRAPRPEEKRDHE